MILLIFYLILNYLSDLCYGISNYEIFESRTSNLKPMYLNIGPGMIPANSIIININLYTNINVDKWPYYSQTCPTGGKKDIWCNPNKDIVEMLKKLKQIYLYVENEISTMPTQNATKTIDLYKYPPIEAMYKNNTLNSNQAVSLIQKVIGYFYYLEDIIEKPINVVKDQKFIEKFESIYRKQEYSIVVRIFFFIYYKLIILFFFII
jgi:hypothetical protein